MFIECLFSGRHCPEHFLFSSSKIPYGVDIIIITVISQRRNWRISNIKVTWLLSQGLTPPQSESRTQILSP